MSVAHQSPTPSAATFRSGGVWDYVSPTRLNLWLRCPLAFRLRYIDRAPPRPSASLLLGQAVHALLAAHYEQRRTHPESASLTASELEQRLDAFWQSAAAAAGSLFRSSAEEQALRAQALSLAAAYLAQTPVNEPRPVAIEASLSAPLADPASGASWGLPLVGVIDLALEACNGARLVDFKTAARGGAPAEAVHEVQLSSYAWLWRATYGEAESSIEIRQIVKTRAPRVETYSRSPCTARHFRRLFTVIRDYLDDLDRGRFTFRPGLACSLCDYCDGGCQSWDG